MDVRYRTYLMECMIQFNIISFSQIIITFILVSDWQPENHEIEIFLSLYILLHHGNNDSLYCVYEAQSG